MLWSSICGVDCTSSSTTAYGVAECIAADGMRRGLFIIERAVQRFILRPIWHAMCATAKFAWKGPHCWLRSVVVTHACHVVGRVLTVVWRSTRWTVCGAWRCASLLATGIRNQVLVPLYFWLQRYVVTPVERYVLAPAWHGVCFVVHAIHDGAHTVFTVLVAGGHMGLRWVLRCVLEPVGRTVAFTAQATASAVSTGTKHVAKVTATAAAATASVVKRGANTVMGAAKATSRTVRAMASEVKAAVRGSAESARGAAKRGPCTFLRTACFYSGVVFFDCGYRAG